MRMFTRSRLVPRQPRAIKNTTRTELRRYNIQNGQCVYWNIGITPIPLRDERIHHGRCIH